MRTKGFTTTALVIMVALAVVVLGVLSYIALTPPQKVGPVVTSTPAAPVGSAKPLPLASTSAVPPTVTPKHEQFVYADYAENGAAYLYDVETNQKTLLSTKHNVSDIAIAPDGNVFYFDDRGIVYAYNFDTQQTAKVFDISSDDYPGASLRAISPNGAYGFIDVGTSPIRAEYLLDIKQGKVIWSDGSIPGGNSMVWSPDSQKFAYAKISIDTGNVTGGDTYLYSVYLGSIQNNTVTATTLLTASHAVDYRPERWADPSSLIFEKDSYSPPFPDTIADGDPSAYEKWFNVFENPEVTYGSINIQTQAVQPVSKAVATSEIMSYGGTGDVAWVAVSPLKDYKLEIGNYQTTLSKLDGSGKVVLSNHNLDVGWRTGVY